MIERDRQYSAIDAARVLMSIIVNAIHVNMFFPIGGQAMQTIFEDFTCIAVPFFFVTSGFFVAGRENSYYKKYLLKLTKTYILWTALYAPLTVYYYWNQDKGIVSSTLQFLQRFLFVGENYYSFHLWYILGLIVCVIMFVLARKILNKYKSVDTIMLVIAMLLYIIGRGISFCHSHQIPVLSQIAKVYMNLFITTRNGPLYGFIFFIAGVWIKTNIERLLGVKWILLLEIFIVSAIMNHYGLFVMLVPEIMSLWLLILRLPVSTGIQKRGKLLRKISEMNYYFHMWPVSILGLTLSASVGFSIAFLMASVLTMVFSVVAYYLLN